MTNQANTTVSDLLPCPFCGDKAISGTTLDDFGYVVCASEKCWGMAGYLASEAEAIAAWNRRATADVTEARKLALGDRVTKAKGSSWTGLVVGFYSTKLTPVGYAVESENEPGSVQIYPEAALQQAPE